MFEFLVIDTAIIEECARPAWLDLAFWMISGGLISGTFQVISEKMGNKNLRIAYKKVLDDNKDLRKKLDILFDRKELYKDTVQILESKIEMYHKIFHSSPSKLEQCSSCVYLVEDMLTVISKTKPLPGSTEEANKTFGIGEKNN